MTDTTEFQGCSPGFHFIFKNQGEIVHKIYIFFHLKVFEILIKGYEVYNGLL